jgi:hypothetical protein
MVQWGVRDGLRRMFTYVLSYDSSHPSRCEWRFSETGTILVSRLIFVFYAPVQNDAEIGRAIE